MLENHMGLVTEITKKFNPRSEHEFDELMQAGRIGLWKAIKGFDGSKARFSTYAYHCIYREMCKEKQFIDKFDYVSLPDNISTSNSYEINLVDYSLSNVQEEIINYRRGNYTWQQICELMSMSKYFVKQHYQEALEKIKNAGK